MVFTWKDFQDLGSRGAIDQALSRLTKTGKIRRVAQGMYDLPRTSRLLRGPAPASTEAVIAAVQRHDHAHIRPDHLAAANALGLTTAVLVQPRYRTTGGRRNIKLGNTTLQLKPAGQKLTDWIDTAAAVPIQALLFLGRDSVDNPQIVRAMRDQLSPDAKEALADDSRYRPQWMQQLISEAVTQT
jgi:Family of unknown function (DUF6088)